MRRVCRKGRPAPAQTAGSHHSEKTELLVWHLPHTRPFPRLPFSVGKLETPSGGEDPVITGAVRKLRSLLLPKSKIQIICRMNLLKGAVQMSHHILTYTYIFWYWSLSNLSKCVLTLPLLSVLLPEQQAETGHSTKIRQGTTHFWSKVLPSKRKTLRKSLLILSEFWSPGPQAWDSVPMLLQGLTSPDLIFSLVHLFVYSFIHPWNMSDEYTSPKRVCPTFI